MSKWSSSSIGPAIVGAFVIGYLILTFERLGCLRDATRPSIGFFFGFSVVLGLVGLAIPSSRAGCWAAAVVLAGFGVSALAMGIVPQDCTT